METNDKYYIGIDLGGTSIKIGLCDAQGQLLAVFEGPTEAEKRAEGVLQNIELYVRELVAREGCNWEQIAGIGAGIPGFLDFEQGLVKASPNLGWKDVPVRQILEDRMGKPVKIDNDANVAALGEVWSGAAAGIPNAVCYTLGTGVGGGIIVKNNLCQGFNGMGGEIGHLKVVADNEAILCGCGKKGCLETVSSATGIIYMAKEAVIRGEQTMLAHHREITAKDVLDAAKAGDPAALHIVDRAADYLGRSMALLSVVVNPQRFVVGGGVAKAGSFLLDRIDRYFREYALGNGSENVDIVPAILGNNAGVVGAAGLHCFG
ncbi:ROK family glucokinase [Paenibacillus sp. NFR01]|uniref:ROK family glucokinase n=1 Tax=Paenibacillus sp. NFR01 TaxID=1566279 RepID=UPI0008C072CF|nr:ROK family glucokinase [Paenibacillus sp. NFR01]SET22163.1 glucokinase [Paenibacillus sp. NFR01]